MLTRDRLERHQVWWYLTAVLLGLAIGSVWPTVGGATSELVWPALALLLYATFSQMPLGRVPAAFVDRRFLLAALIGNFVVVPLLVGVLVRLVPDDPALRLGLLLVLLVPCTDWFITFSQLGRGDATRATALTPVTLLLQLLLLPLYLWLMADVDLGTVLGVGDLWPALLVVVVPLVLAGVTEAWVGEDVRRRDGVQRLSWWPVPLLAVVITLVAAAHVGEVRAALDVLPVVVAVAVAYLVLALVVARGLAAVAGLPVAQGRTLAFSLGTRNSFVVLPFALALPAGWDVAAMVVVTQSLVELFGMIAYLWLVPRIVFPEDVRPQDPGRLGP